MRASRLLGIVAVRSAVLVWMGICVFPFGLMFYTSFRHSGVSVGGGFDTGYGLQNYGAVLTDPTQRFLGSLGTSIVLSAVVTTLTLFLAVPAAIALVTHSGRCARILEDWLLSTRFLPAVLVALPLFLLLARLGLAPGMIGMAVVCLVLTLPLATLLLAALIRRAGMTTFELLHVDGIGSLRAARHVLLPLLRGPVLLAASLSWLLVWNEFFIALVFGTDPRPLPVLIASWNTYQGVQWGPACAAATLSALPILIGAGLVVGALRFGARTHDTLATAPDAYGEVGR